jgi:hypothetical protein
MFIEFTILMNKIVFLKVDKIKNNRYINFGNMKNVFEYLFENVYDKKFARFVNF